MRTLRGPARSDAAYVVLRRLRARDAWQSDEHQRHVQRFYSPESRCALHAHTENPALLIRKLGHLRRV